MHTYPDERVVDDVGAAHLEAQEGHGRRRAHHGVQQRHAPLRVHADAVLVVQPEGLRRHR